MHHRATIIQQGKGHGMPRNTTLVLKILLIKILSKNVTVKNIHIDIIAPNFTHFYRQIFKIFKIIFFMDGTQKK
jgi:hypothetical protein